MMEKRLGSEGFRALIAADHPSLAGHFPDHPVVPGVLILEEVVRAFAEWQPEVRLSGISVAKFLIPLQPGQPFLIRFEQTVAGGCRFSCIRQPESEPIAHGSLRVRVSLESPDESPNRST